MALYVYFCDVWWLIGKMLKAIVIEMSYEGMTEGDRLVTSKNRHGVDVICFKLYPIWTIRIK